MSLLRPILKTALLHPRRTAVVDDQRTWSYGKLLAGAMHLRRAIRQATERQNVGIMLPTSGAFPVCLLGAWMAERTVVPLNYLLSREELAYVIRDSEIDVILTVEKMVEFVGGEEVIPEGVKLVRVEQLDYSGIPPVAWPPKPKDDDLAAILYTSGTSGRPKGVMLSHGNLHCNVDDGIHHARLTRADTFLGVLPQFHSFGLTVLTLLPLYIGAELVYSARFIPRKLVELMRKHRPQVFIAVPSMYGALLSVKDATPEDFESLRFIVSGGEPLPDAISEAYQDRFGVEILEGYGLTETSPATNWCTPWGKKRFSVGTPLPRVGNYILGEDGSLLGPNEDGEILITGPNVMQGYFKQPELTKEVMVEITPPGEDSPRRAFRTGDIGHIDDDGFLFITGRKKEMLIIGGENVFPREIEEVLNRHPSVKASAVVGQRDGVRGEVPVAFVELVEDAAFDANALKQHCREALAGYKVPRDIHMVDELPRNPTGKVLRRELATRVE